MQFAAVAGRIPFAHVRILIRSVFNCTLETTHQVMYRLASDTLVHVMFCIVLEVLQLHQFASKRFSRANNLLARRLEPSKPGVQTLQ